MEFLFPLIFWFIFAGLVAKFANSRGRNLGSWFFIALMISPILAFLILILLPTIETDKEALVALYDESEVLTGEELADRIRKAHTLLTSGVYSDIEFEKAKARIFMEIELNSIEKDKTSFLTPFIPLLDQKAITHADLETIKKHHASKHPWA